MGEFVFPFVVVLFSVVVHEIAHGYAALSLGDATAKYAGRLTLNPLKHIDPLGTVFLPLFLFVITLGKGPIFGWARPVPVNPYFFRDQKYGMVKVAIAGPLSNFLVAIFFAALLRIPFFQSFLLPFSLISIYNFLLGFFNLIPIPPLDGYHLFSELVRNEKINFFLLQYSFLLILLVIFFGINFVSFLSHLCFHLISGV